MRKIDYEEKYTYKGHKVRIVQYEHDEHPGCFSTPYRVSVEGPVYSHCFDTWSLEHLSTSIEKAIDSRLDRKAGAS